jgi:hypothetical protein
MFLFASVDVDALCDFQRVPSCSEWGVGVCMTCVVYPIISCFMEDFTINSARVCHIVRDERLNELTEAGVEVG